MCGRDNHMACQLITQDKSKNEKLLQFLEMPPFPKKEVQCLLRLGAQSVMLLNTLKDPTQLRQRQWATRQLHLFFGCPLLSSLEQLISAPNHE